MFEDMPFGLGIWLDATDINADDNPDGLADGSIVNSWLDKSSHSRDMPNFNGDPSIKLDGLNGLQVVDFDGNDRIWTDYNFRANNAVDWRSLGYPAFGVSRYTGGDNERANRTSSSLTTTFFAPMLPSGKVLTGK